MSRILNGTGAALLLALSVAGAADAQHGAVGTLVVAHGAGPEWNSQVEEVVALARTEGPIEVSYLMGPAAAEHRFQEAAARLVEKGAREIVVVPLLISSHSGHYDQIRYLAGDTDEISEMMLHHLSASGTTRASVAVPVHLTPAIDSAAAVAEVLAERALAIAEAPGEQALFIVGHGPNSAEDNAAWMSNLRPIADRVGEATGFVDVKVGLVRDDAPAMVREEAVRTVRETIELQHRLTGRPVVVVPVMVASGGITRERIPQDLEGLPVVYLGDALLPHPGMALWIEDRVREAAGGSHE